MRSLGGFRCSDEQRTKWNGEGKEEGRMEKNVIQRAGSLLCLLLVFIFASVVSSEMIKFKIFIKDQHSCRRYTLLSHVRKRRTPQSKLCR